ncbi:hypothetical protein QAD02_011058 [Eretmocerus hayati]|uniref:Uncharacterized protein n=1 Tax=Eretmocerus hayati TaxID=131215 RepID=A0ACC2NVZ1_9HYME|nr:hypothetical protein QAD02_011058 [Eretmocerus hayati]
MAGRNVWKFLQPKGITRLQHTRYVAGNAAMSGFDIQHKINPIPKAYYGGRHTVTLLPGSGIGPELMGYVREIFKYAGVPVDFEQIDISPDTESNDDFEYAVTSIRRNGVALKGNIETGSESVEVMSRNVGLRDELDLFVYVLHCHHYPGVQSRQKDIDMVVIRQNTEGEYAMLEHESVEGVVESMKVITAANSERVIRYAFEYARHNNRKKITTIHKAIYLQLSDGLFLETSRKVAKDYPDIKFNDMIMDDACAELVANPHQFDIVLSTNLYGLIVSNIMCGLLGGAGLYAGKNYGNHYAVFEPATRSTGKSMVGKNVANPVAMINASVAMLRHLGHEHHATIIRNAILKTLAKGVHTPDLGGTATSRDVVDGILKYIKEATT